MEGMLTRKREKLTDYRDDYWSCGKCKMCQSINVQKVISARFSANCPCGTRYRFESYYAAGMLEIARAITNFEFEPGEKTARIIYSCNLCGLCQEMCFPLKGLHTTRIIQLMREKAADEGWGPLPGHREVLQKIEESDNPMGLESGFKGKVVSGRGVKDITRDKAENLLFIGCALASGNGMDAKLAAIIDVLQAAGLDFGVLGDSEPCCRSYNLEVGDRDGFEKQASRNIELFQSSGAQRMITACPHCLNVFREEYGEAIGMEVVHISQVLSELLEEGKLKPELDVEGSFAYHDPCFLGRWCEEYEQPRQVLGTLPGTELVEFERNLENSWCCGAGGGVPQCDPDLADWTAKERQEEARAVGASAIVTACPHCEGHLSANCDIPVYDLCELVSKSLERS